ncbi:hypothetical protein K2173_025485 [Erythroxylum novogranatense]|uniref:Uncharacterized protein n=1 Tax=Erythroxylum novogranatense TaxID=1862640 RepID=A0AAV8SB36_9ROSI|nr:hypothetical protein K2173_025485 [Erythroxylum novogranatense]
MCQFIRWFRKAAQKKALTSCRVKWAVVRYRNAPVLAFYVLILLPEIFAGGDGLSYADRRLLVRFVAFERVKRLKKEKKVGDFSGETEIFFSFQQLVLVYNDTSEGRKVCTHYKLDSVPAVLVIDPITGQKMRSRSGMVQYENLLEDLVAFMDGGPRDRHKTLFHKRPRGISWTPDKDKDAYEHKSCKKLGTYPDT